MKVILTIAGFDPSAGAGVLADIKTFAACGCYGSAVITSLTSQNTIAVYDVFHQSARVVQAQLEPILADYEVAAVKIGLLPTAELIEFVAATIVKYGLKKIVLDPVMFSSSGFALVDGETQKLILERLLPLTTIVTPNLDEIGALTGLRAGSIEEMKVAAAALTARFSGNETVPAVLVKGGHLEGEAADVLYHQNEFSIFRSPKIVTRHTHGTGCTFSAALAAFLGRDNALRESVEKAKRYVTNAIKHAPQLGHGSGPLNHFFND